MTVDQAVYQLATKVRELKSIIETEEATKTAFVVPFISQVLGYDVSDPREVIPEYTADIGKKKGEKVDYAIKSGTDFRFLIECKKIGEPLHLDHATQLIRYFNVTDTEFAILTNGEVYEFYAQLDAMNRMDEKPFMTIDLGSVDARVFPHLEKCTKSRFDPESIAASAEELKYVSEIKKILALQFREPDPEWVKFLTARVTTKRMTAAVLEQFSKIVHTATAQFLKDEANRRLRSAQDLEEVAVPAAPLGSSNEDGSIDSAVDPAEPDTGIFTTEDELAAFNIVRAIGCSEVPANDISMRDSKSYCAILYKDNNRKPIARLYFDRKIPRIGIFDKDRNEAQYDLAMIEEIFQYSDEIRERVRMLRDEL